MRAGEADNEQRVARGRRPAPTIRALGALAVLAALLVLVTGGLDGPAPTPQASARRSGRIEVLGEQVTRDEVAVGTSTTTSTTASTTASTTVTTTPPAVVPVSRPAVSTTCADALTYLAAHQAPGFIASCADGSAFGHLGVTCVNQAGMCEGQRYIHIACPAPFVYMNEAHNSWTLIGARTGIDPYGQGTDAERAACASHR